MKDRTKETFKMIDYYKEWQRTHDYLKCGLQDSYFAGYRKSIEINNHKILSQFERFILESESNNDFALELCNILIDFKRSIK